MNRWLPGGRRGIGALLLAALAACGGGGGDDEQTSGPPTEAPLTLVSKADRSYGALHGSRGARVELFRRADGSMQQASYDSAASGEQVRVLYDADGLPQRLIDAKTGAAVIVERVSAQRTDFRTYAGDGTYLDGYAVLNRGGQISVAAITGAPSFSGQLSGQINGSLQTGSFAVLPAEGVGLGGEAAPTAAQLALADAIVSGAAVALREQPTRVARERAQAILGIDGRAIVVGLVVGATVGATSHPAAGLIAGAMMMYGMQNYLLPVIDGVKDADSLEDLPALLNPFINGFNRGTPAGDAVHAALAGGSASTVGELVSRAFDAARDSIGSLLDPSSLPPLNAAPSPVATPVSGFGVDQQGMSYAYSGTVLPSGGVTLVGNPADGGQGVDATGVLNSGQLSGAASGRLGNGPLSGQAAALGLCAQLQQSGGQGTFSYAFDAAATSGTVPFYYDAYTIPDAFRVISSGATLYDTGGLVSGSNQVGLQLNGSRVLFVTVNAPRSGTLWELSVGCPS